MLGIDMQFGCKQCSMICASNVHKATLNLCISTIRHKSQNNGLPERQ